MHFCHWRHHDVNRFLFDITRCLFDVRCVMVLQLFSIFLSWRQSFPWRWVHSWYTQYRPLKFRKNICRSSLEITMNWRCWTLEVDQWHFNRGYTPSRVIRLPWLVRRFPCRGGGSVCVAWWLPWLSLTRCVSGGSPVIPMVSADYQVQSVNSDKHNSK